MRQLLFLNMVVRVKLGRGIHYDLLSLKSPLQVLFYLSSQTAHLWQSATSMQRWVYLNALTYLFHPSVNPLLQDPAWQILHINMREFFISIQNILVGNSSSLYQWDPLSETFVLPPTAEGKKVFIVVDGKDDVLMQRHAQSNTFGKTPSHCAFSYTKRFLAIGSLLRRLDIFANNFRRWCVTSKDK
jgi:hypothetical protein